MVIGTGDGKSYKDEYSYLVARHEDLSQQSQVADLDKRTPPPLPMVPSHSIAPHNPNPPGGGPYQIKPGERLASLVDKSAPAQWIGDKYYGRLFDTVDEYPTSNIKLEHGKPGSHFGTISPKEEIEMARDREDNPKIFKPDKQEVIPGTPITDPMLGYGSSRDVRISDVSPDPVTAGQQYAQTLPDYAQDLQQKEYKKYWESMPEKDFRARVRDDAEQNVMAPVLWRSKEYFKMWDEERDKIKKEGPLTGMSPKQLREKGIKP